MVQRSLFSRAFWREYRLSMLRSRRDARSRKMFLRLNILLLVAIFWVGYQVFILHMLHDTGTTIGVVSVLVVILAAIGGVRWAHWREAKRTLAADIALAPAGVVARLQHLTHGLAALEERALSEIFLQNHALPENAEIITRRIQIGALKQRGSWEQLPIAVRDWLARPDRSWSMEEAVRVTQFAETLHTLLWAQALLPKLRPLDSVMDKLDFGKLARALKRPSLGILPTWELRVERNAANHYFSRCLAEQIHRGNTESEDEKQLHAVEDWIKSIQEDDSPEFFAGSAKVSELKNGGLQRLSHATAQRTAVLGLVMNLLDGEEAWDGLEKIMFAPVLQTSEEKNQRNTEESASTKSVFE